MMAGHYFILHFIRSHIKARNAEITIIMIIVAFNIAPENVKILLLFKFRFTSGS